MTFKTSYRILFNELEKLFIKNYKKLIYGTYYTKKNKKNKKFIHKSKDLHFEHQKWGIKILNHIKNRNQNVLNNEKKK